MSAHAIRMREQSKRSLPNKCLILNEQFRLKWRQPPFAEEVAGTDCAQTQWGRRDRHSRAVRHHRPALNLKHDRAETAKEVMVETRAAEMVRTNDGFCAGDDIGGWLRFRHALSLWPRAELEGHMTPTKLLLDKSRSC